MLLTAKRHLSYGGRKYAPGDRFDCKVAPIAAAYLKARSAEKYEAPAAATPPAPAPPPPEPPKPEPEVSPLRERMQTPLSVPQRRRQQAASADSPPEAPSGEYERRDLRARTAEE